jgi:hypothetical protein
MVRHPVLVVARGWGERQCLPKPPIDGATCAPPWSATRLRFSVIFHPNDGLQWRKTPANQQYCTSQKPSYNARVPSRKGWKHQLFKAPETY